MGTPQFAVETLNGLVKKHEVVGVFTNPDKPVGRKQIVSFSEVKRAAIDLKIPVFQPKKFEEKDLDVLKNFSPDVIVVVAYGKILSREVLSIPKYGCINVHGSLLPKYRGASPIQASIINCEKETGISIIQMTENLDDGDILKVYKTSIGLNETYLELSKRLSEIGALAILEVLKEIEEGTLKRIPQKEEEATYVTKIKKEMGKINFNEDSLIVHKLICGLSFWPSAYCFLNGRVLKIYKSILNEEYKGNPGEVLDEKRFIVGCKKGAVEFLEVQLQNRKRISARDFLNGVKLKKGDFLE